MFVIREVMHCKPGKVSELVKRFKALSAIVESNGHKGFRILTDMSAEQFWTLIAETEVESVDAFLEMERETMADDRAREAFGGYHEFIIDGRREIYRIES